MYSVGANIFLHGHGAGNTLCANVPDTALMKQAFSGHQLTLVQHNELACTLQCSCDEEEVTGWMAFSQFAFLCALRKTC